MKDNLDKEFDEKFVGYLVMTDGCNILYKPRNKIKSFIRQWEERLKKELIEKIEKEKWSTNQYTKLSKVDAEYNRAIKKAIEIIKSN